MVVGDVLSQNSKMFRLQNDQPLAFVGYRSRALRQNQVSKIDFPPNLNGTLVELDLYDNLISHIKGLDGLVNLSSLDLSFNNIKHIKNVSHLTKLRDLYLVQNRISSIEGLDGLTELKNLELGANRIRVTSHFPFRIRNVFSTNVNLTSYTEIRNSKT
jgi:Leucine-rich repeat (LRR) protein